ncbi:hypothetical protein C2G38_2262485 [Gigaspora rosea]|uniref:Uncharacterized protein n=1 Tax=Gigaspora rosea TaxID=44941 RepID=A0A397UU96_9GLOM|nr:hypothetical protein C2G38_2262485 [Gigaspora rosea]
MVNVNQQIVLMTFYYLLKMENVEFNKYVMEKEMIFKFGDGSGFVPVKVDAKDLVVELANVLKYVIIMLMNIILGIHLICISAVYEVMLTEVDSDHPVRMIIKGNHVPQNIIQQTTALSQINLSREAQDLVIKSRRANKRTPKEIKSKLLALHNGASQHELQNLYSQHLICDDIKLRQFIERDKLHTRSQIGPWQQYMN